MLWKVRKRQLTLLEVLVAFSIAVMSIFPLIYPHIIILRQQSLYTEEVEMNHAVKLLFGDIYRHLYQRDIPFNDIMGERRFPIDEQLLKEAGYEKKPRFTGDYRFKFSKGKSNPEKTKAAYIFALIFELKLNGEKRDKPYSYVYELFIYQEAPPSSQEVKVEEED